MIEPSRSLEVDANEDVAAVGVEGGYEKASDKVGNYCKFAVISENYFRMSLFIKKCASHENNIVINWYWWRYRLLV